MHFLLEQSQRDVRRNVILQDFFDGIESTTISEKIAVLEGLDYVTALCKLNESIISARPDTASLIALYDNIRISERDVADNDKGDRKGKKRRNGDDALGTV